MYDYDGPAFNKNSRKAPRLASDHGKSQPFEPAFKIAKEAIKKKRPRLKTWETDAFSKTYKSSRIDEEPYQVPFLKDKEKPSLAKVKELNREMDEFDKINGSSPSSRSVYQPSLTTNKFLNKDFIPAQDSLDQEEDKAYHKTARQKYEPSFQIPQADWQEVTDPSEAIMTIDEGSSPAMNDEDEVVDEELVFQAKKLPKPYKTKALNPIDENIRALSRRLVKSKDSFILFDYQEEK